MGNRSASTLVLAAPENSTSARWRCRLHWGTSTKRCLMLNCHCPQPQQTQTPCAPAPPDLRFCPLALKATEGDVGTTVTFHKVMQASMPRSVHQAGLVTLFAALHWPLATYARLSRSSSRCSSGEIRVFSGVHCSRVSRCSCVGSKSCMLQLYRCKFQILSDPR